MVHFEGIERRIDKIKAVLAQYQMDDLQKAGELLLSNLHSRSFIPMIILKPLILLGFKAVLT